LAEARQTRVRYLIVTILFVVSCFSFADRSALSQAVAAMPKGMNLNAERLGYLLFAFGWAYALGQLPS
jgi:MFS transporter, ACS family, glucarate transporter